MKNWNYAEVPDNLNTLIDVRYIDGKEENGIYKEALAKGVERWRKHILNNKKCVPSKQPKDYKQVSDLIKSFNIFSQYIDQAEPFNYTDNFILCFINPKVVTDEDKEELELIGFIISVDGDYFYSLEYEHLINYIP